MNKADSSYALASSPDQGPMRFLFEGLQVRAIDHAARPWFVGKDVCEVLGHKDTKQALSRLPDSERATVKVADALGRDQNTTIISIAGVFRLAMTSRVAGAERFQAWVTDEVLPQIYTRGTYGAPKDAALERLTATVASLASRMGTMEDRVSMLERVSTSKPAPALPSLPPRLPRGPAPSVSPTGLITLGSERLQLHRVGNGWGCFALELGRLLGYCNNGRKLLSYLAPTGHWHKRFLNGVHVVRDPRVMLTMEGMRLACGLSRAENAQRLLPALASEPAEPDREDDRSPAVRIRPAPSLPHMTAVQVGDTLWVCPALIRQSRAAGKVIAMLPH